LAASCVLMNRKSNHAAVDILPGVQLAELGISLTIMIVQRAKWIEGLFDSEGQERQMGQELTGSLHTKENIENFDEKPVQPSPNVSSEDVPDSPFYQGIYVRRRILCQLLSALVYCPPPRLSQLQFSADSMADSIRSPLYYCPPDLKLKRTVRTVRTVFRGIMEEPSVNH
jgi:hypothetical protein